MLGRGHGRREARPGHVGLVADELQLLGRGQRRVRTAEHAALHRAGVADPAGQRAGVDAGDADDAVAHQVLVERRVRAVVRDHAAGVAHHVPGDPDATGLGVLVVHARVADVRRGLHHDLPGVGRVGQGLLVAGHPGREHHLAEGASAGAVGPAVVAGAVLEDQHGPFACHQFVPSPAVCGWLCFVDSSCRATSAAASSSREPEVGVEVRRTCGAGRRPSQTDQSPGFDHAVDGRRRAVGAAEQRRRRSTGPPHRPGASPRRSRGRSGRRGPGTRVRRPRCVPGAGRRGSSRR